MRSGIGLSWDGALATPPITTLRIEPSPRVPISRRWAILVSDATRAALLGCRTGFGSTALKIKANRLLERALAVANDSTRSTHAPRRA
jgi:hypothetical protein